MNNLKISNEIDLQARDNLIKNYLASNHVRKLQIGAGPFALDGWLSTDIAPASDRIIFMDAADIFPFADGSFDYVFSEHMIEHLTLQQGLFMLKECRRVLKPGGIIRIATPNLEILLGLYASQGLDAKSDNYIKWITDTFLTGVGVYRASLVINKAFQNWGHKFLYDGDLLSLALREAGFIKLRRCNPGTSENQNLMGIECHGILIANEEIARFETMVFEAETQ